MFYFKIAATSNAYMGMGGEDAGFAIAGESPTPDTILKSVATPNSYADFVSAVMCMQAQR